MKTERLLHISRVSFVAFLCMCCSQVFCCSCSRNETNSIRYPNCLKMPGRGRGGTRNRARIHGSTRKPVIPRGKPTIQRVKRRNEKLAAVAASVVKAKATTAAAPVMKTKGNNVKALTGANESEDECQWCGRHCKLDKVCQHCREGFDILTRIGQEAEARCSMDEDPDFVVLDFESRRPATDSEATIQRGGSCDQLPRLLPSRTCESSGVADCV